MYATVGYTKSGKSSFINSFLELPENMKAPAKRGLSVTKEAKIY